MTKDEAENVAISALAWMAQDEDIIGGFMGVTGASPEDLRSRASDPDFLGFVLDYLLSDDAMIMAFSDATGISANAPLIARDTLPGQATPHWT